MTAIPNFESPNLSQIPDAGHELQAPGLEGSVRFEA